MRIVAVLFLIVSCGLIAAEWMSPSLGIAPGELVSAALVLCVSANLLSMLLLFGRRR